MLTVNQRVNGAELSDYWLVLFVLVVQNLRVVEVLDQVVQALQSGVGEIADLSSIGFTFSLLNLLVQRLF